MDNQLSFHESLMIMSDYIKEKHNLTDEIVMKYLTFIQNLPNSVLLRQVNTLHEFKNTLNESKLYLTEAELQLLHRNENLIINIATTIYTLLTSS